MMLRHPLLLGPLASFLLGLLLLVTPFARNGCGEDDVPQQAEERRFAMVVVGLPGDDERRAAYQQLVDSWTEWLVDRAGFAREDVSVLFGRDGQEAEERATAENIRLVADRLVDQADRGDTVWLLLLGHGSQDNRHAWFHLPGPDMHEAEWAGLFATLDCREQVFWLTQAASGAFVKSMSRPGRVVIAATAESGEVNETQFPVALAEVMQKPPSEVDSNGDGATSLLELFRATTDIVAACYAEKMLAPTEHAQLDDNGDGRGSEIDAVITDASAAADDSAGESDSAADQSLDGAVAAAIIVDLNIDSPAKISR